MHWDTTVSLLNALNIKKLPEGSFFIICEGRI